jgi:hypothetical protein
MPKGREGYAFGEAKDSLTDTTRTAKPKKESPLGVHGSLGAFPLGVRPMEYSHS